MKSHPIYTIQNGKKKNQLKMRQTQIDNKKKKFCWVTIYNKTTNKLPVELFVIPFNLKSSNGPYVSHTYPHTTQYWKK